MPYTQTIIVRSKGFCDIIDITDKVSLAVRKSEIKNGIAVIFVPGSTAAITTLEANAGLEDDLKEVLEKIAPQNKTYHHDEKWGDGNGFSHIRASLFGPSLTIPIVQGELILGTWQQIVLCDFDNRARERKIVIQIMGE